MFLAALECRHVVLPVIETDVLISSLYTTPVGGKNNKTKQPILLGPVTILYPTNASLLSLIKLGL